MTARDRLLAAVAGLRPDDETAEILARLVDPDGPRGAAESSLARVVRELGERVKELTALYAAAGLLQDESRDEPAVLTSIVAILPPAFLHAADAEARIVCGGAAYQTGGFTVSPWVLRAPFRTADGLDGAVEVAYRTSHAAETEGPFLAEERRLLDSIATLLGLSLERRRAAERLRFLVSSERIRIFEWDLAAGRLTWPGIPEATADGSPRARAMDLGEVFANIHPDDQPAVRRVVDAVRQGGPAAVDLTAEYRAAFQPGVYRWRHLTARVLRDAQGAPVRVIGISVDIAEQRALQDRLRQGQKMEALGLLAGGVAHDFNNILAGIIGFAELGVRELAEAHPVRGYLRHVLQAGNTAAALIRQIMAFGRRQDLRPDRVDLRTLVTATGSLLGHLVGRQVKIRHEFAADAPEASVDPNQFQQVLLNLAANARDAMPSGGPLTLRVHGRRCVAPRPDGSTSGEREWAVLEVEDGGTGMSPEVLERIFEPFFTTKGEGKGTGLGLATVHGIVTQSGGFVDVESAVGRGTRFRAHFPTPGASATGS